MAVKEKPKKKKPKQKNNADWRAFVSIRKLKSNSKESLGTNRFHLLSVLCSFVVIFAAKFKILSNNSNKNDQLKKKNSNKVIMMMIKRYNNHGH